MQPEPALLAALLEILTFRAGYNTSLVLVGVALLGAAAGLVGTFAMLRKRALMSDALSHAALPGIAGAFLLATLVGASGRSLWLLLGGAAVSGIIGVLTIQFVTRRTRLPEDAALGAVLSVFFGLGFVLLSYIQTMARGDQGGIAKFIYGQTAAMTAVEATSIAVVGGLAVLSVLAFYKEFRLVAFDPDFAGTQGWPVSAIDLLMMALVVAVTVVGLRAVGLILIIALLIIPPAAARFWTERLSRMLLLAALFGALSCYLGAAASALVPRLPAGGIIVLTAGAVFLLSLLFAPARGVLAAAWRQTRLRLDVACQHVLRALYEAVERGEMAWDAGFDLAGLRPMRSWPASWRTLVLHVLTYRGLIGREGGTVRLTPAGRAQAARVTRNHRLWEQFLISNAELAPSHVDHSADLVEHVLSPEMVQALERALLAAGRLPERPTMPPSAHPLGGGQPA